MGWGGGRGGWGKGRGGGGWGRGRGGGWGSGGGGWGWFQQMPQMPILPPPPPGTLRVVVSVENNSGLDSIVSPRFGRSPFFAVVDISGGKVANVQIVQNPCIDMPHGVGVAVAQWILSIGARVVIGSHFGPNVMMVLQQAGIKVCNVQPGIRVIDALKVCGLV